MTDTEALDLILRVAVEAKNCSLFHSQLDTAIEIVREIRAEYEAQG